LVGGRLFFLIAGLSAPAAAQDGESIDSTITALYEVISGDVGEARDWDRFRSLFADGALLAAGSPGPDGEGRANVITPDGYVTNFGPGLIEIGFKELETRRATYMNGHHMATVLSAYEGIRQDTGETIAVGVNTLILAQMEGEWKVVSVAWMPASQDWPPENVFEPVDE